jgi:hypothetical protein
LVLCLIGRCTEYFLYRPVRRSLHWLGCRTEPRKDVYSYNFSDDKLYLKLLGRHQVLTALTFRLDNFMEIPPNSISRPSRRDCPNDPDWPRCLPLVRCRIQKHWDSRAALVYPYRYSNHVWAHCAHCPNVLLLSYLDIEQTAMVALHTHCYRTFDISHLVKRLTRP